MDISEEAIANNRAYVIISKQVERVSRDAVEALNSKEIILIFPTSRPSREIPDMLRQTWLQKYMATLLMRIEGKIQK